MKKDNGITTKNRPATTNTADNKEGPSQLVERLLERYNRKRGMLIPIMQDIQEECEYLPVDVLKELSQRMEVPLSQIFSVATFSPCSAWPLQGSTRSPCAWGRCAS